MAAPAAVLNILLTANSMQLNSALAKANANLAATGKTAQATSATTKKALLGIGAAAIGAGAALYKIGEEFDNAYDKIRIRTGDTGKEMVKLKRAFRDVVSDVPASFDDASEAVGGLNQRLGLTGAPLRRVSKQITELSRLTGTDVEANVRTVSRAFVDWEVATKDQSRTLDGLFRLSQKSGLAVEDIAESVQKFGSPLRQLGFSLEESAAMFASFEKAGVNAQTMVPGFKLAISNLTRPTETLAASMAELGIKAGDPEKALRKVFAILSDDNRSQIVKTGLAMDVFGKRAGADMAEAIKQGRFELDEFIKVMKKGDGTILESGRKTMDAAEAFQVFKNNVMLALEPLAKDVFKGLGELMKDVTKAFKKGGINEVISVLSDKLADAAPKIVEAGAKLGGAIIRGIWDAFQETSILGKLFIAGGLLRLFGGKGAITKAAMSMGGMLGRQIGIGTTTAATSTVAAGAGGQMSLFGSMKGRLTSMSGRWRTLGKVGIGVGLAAGIIAALKDKDFLENLENTLDDLLPLPGMEDFGEGGKPVPDVLHPGLSDKGVKEATAKAQRRLKTFWDAVEEGNVGALRRLQARLQKHPLSMAEYLSLPEKLQQKLAEMGRRLPKMLGDISDMPAWMDTIATDIAAKLDIPLNKAQKVQNYMKNHPGLGAREALAAMEASAKNNGKAWDRWESGTNKATKEARQHLAKLAKDGGISMKELRSTSDRELRILMRRGGTSFRELAEAARRGMDNMGQNLNEVLRALGIKKPVQFVTKKAAANLGLTPQGAQKGAVIVPGSGSGDKVPLHLNGQLAALVEPGELVSVANRNATKRLMEANAAVPRFARGGTVSGDIKGLVPAFLAGLRGLAGATTPISVTSGFRSHAEQVALWNANPNPMMVARPGTSNHEKGIAADISPQRPAYGGAERRFGLGFPMSWEPWHIELMNAAAAGRAGAAQKIARIILTQMGGVEGRQPMEEAGQRVLDKVRGAANDYISKQMPAIGRGGVSPEMTAGKFSKQDLVSLWNRTGRSGDANLMAAIALAESGGNPSIVNPSSQATGLWQIIPSTWAAFGRGSFARAKDPTANALAAHGILSGQGLGAWEAYTNNAYSQYLQRGGIVGLQKGTKGLGPGSGINILPPKGWEPLKEKLAFWRKESGRLETVASEFETFYQSLASPGGEDVTEQEKRDLVGLFGSLVGALQKRRRLVQQGLKLPWMKGDKKEKSLEQELVNLQGVTGLGGLIQAAKASRDTWAGTVTGPAIDYETLWELQKQLTSEALADAAVSAAQLPVFRAFANAPIMHDGGTVPGVSGQSVPVIAQAGETVTPAGSPQVTVIIEDGAVDPNKIRVVVDGHLTDKVRKARSGSKVVPGRRSVIR